MTDAIHFAPFRLNLRQARLLKGDDPVALRPKTFAVLVYLAQHRGELVTKRDLLDAVWKNIAVTDDMPRISVRELRRALGDDAREPRFIETVRGQGYRFIGVEQCESAGFGFSASAVEETLPPVGRDEELVVLDSLVAAAMQGRRRMALVSGEAGIGKTTLVDAALNRVGSGTTDRTLIGRGQCIEQRGEAEAYHPLLEVVADWCRGPMRETVTEVLQTVAPTWARELPWLLQESSGAGAAGLSAANGDRIRREFCALIEGLARNTTVVLVLEDLHWSDESTLALLRVLAQRREPVRLLLLGTVQSADALSADHPLVCLKEDLSRKDLCCSLPLERFDRVSVEGFLKRRFSDAAIARALSPIVHAQTGGNPFFVRAVSEYLVEEGLLTETEGVWMLNGDAGSLGRRRGERWLETPGSIRHMVEIELERLDPRERNMLEAASLTGIEFTAQLVAVSSDTDLEEVEEVCDSLARRGRLIRTSGEARWPDGSVGGRYVFLQTVYREVLQQRVSPARRRRWHELIAARLEAGFPEKSDEIARQMAMHCEGGGAIDRAVHWLERAADTAVRSSTSRETNRLLARALELLRMVPESPAREERELRLRLALAPSLAAEHGLGSQKLRQVYVEARDLGNRVGCEGQSGTARLGLHLNDLARGDLSTAVDRGREWLASAENESAGSILDARLAVGLPLYFLGELEEARDHFTHAVEAFDPGVPQHPSPFYGGGPVDASCYLAWTLWKLGFPEEAKKVMDDAMDLARRLGQPSGMACALSCGAWLRHYERDVDGALAMSEAAVDLAQEKGLRIWREAAGIVHGWALVDAGRYDEALELMTKQFRSARTLGQHISVRYAVARFAEATARAGNVAGALAQIEPILNGGSGTEEQVYQSHLHRLHGNLLVWHGGRDGEAERAFELAAGTAAGQQARALELQALTDLSRLWQSSGQLQAARARLTPVVESFPSGLDTHDLSDARELLRQLDA